MRFLIALLTISCSCSCWGKDFSPRVVVERISGWRASPVYAQNLTADAQVFVFYSDGRFGVINGILGKSSRSHEISVLFGAGYSVFSGCWSVKNGKANAVAEPVYMPSPTSPKPAPRRYEFEFNGKGLMTSPKIRNQLVPHGSIVGMPNILPVTDTLESRTRSFESSSGMAVWRCVDKK